jgi:hypothetical protein
LTAGRTPVSTALIIDDIDESLGMLSALGQEILRTPVQSIRDAVYRFADRYNWRVVRHRSFAAWAEEHANKHLAHWLVLDPLFVSAESSDRYSRIRTSRRHDLSIPPIHIDPELKHLVADGAVGIIDDAASSGRTLRAVTMAARSIGLRVSTVLLCAASRAAYHQVCASGLVSRWNEFVPGDWEVMHLRDGFPFLPFAGRPTAHAAIEVGSAFRLQVRTSSVHASGSPWQVLQHLGAVASAVKEARREVEAALTRHLGRPAIVADLPLLGAAVNVFVEPTAPIVSHLTSLAAVG